MTKWGYCTWVAHPKHRRTHVIGWAYLANQVVCIDRAHLGAAWTPSTATSVGETRTWASVAECTATNPTIHYKRNAGARYKYNKNLKQKPQFVVCILIYSLIIQIKKKSKNMKSGIDDLFKNQNFTLIY